MDRSWSFLSFWCFIALYFYFFCASSQC